MHSPSRMRLLLRGHSERNGARGASNIAPALRIACGVTALR